MFQGVIATLVSTVAVVMAATPTVEMQEVLDRLVQLGAQPVQNLTPEQARTQATPGDAAREVAADKGIEPDPTTGFVAVNDITIQSQDGVALPARVYQPEGPTPLPVVLFFHGGGWVIGSKDAYDASAREISRMTGALVVSVDYRLAPEYKFPTAHDDAFRAYKWLLANARSLNGDPAKVAVAGESAGGNLALNVAIRARDEAVPAPSHVLAVYPVARGDMQTESYGEYENAAPLSKAGMHWFFSHYLNNSAEALDPRISLVLANLTSLPEVTIIGAEIDPLLSEGKNLADAIRAQGGAVNYKLYPGVTHEFFGMGDLLAPAKEAEQYAADELKGSF